MKRTISDEDGEIGKHLFSKVMMSSGEIVEYV
jgi:hypothetical protein